MFALTDVDQEKNEIKIPILPLISKLDILYLNHPLYPHFKMPAETMCVRATFLCCLVLLLHPNLYAQSLKKDKQISFITDSSVMKLPKKELVSKTKKTRFPKQKIRRHNSESDSIFPLHPFSKLRDMTPEVGGSAYIDFRVSDWQDTFSRIPANYLRVGLNPSLTVKNIPLQANVYYTTEEGPVGNHLRNINITLDLPKIQQQVQKGLMARGQAMKKELAGNKIDLDYNKCFRDPKSWPDPGRLTDRDPHELLSMLNYSDYINKLSPAKYKRMRDSIRIYDPSSLGRFDSMYAVAKLVDMPEDSFQLQLDTARGKNAALFGQAEQMRRLKSFSSYRPKDLAGKGDSLYRHGLIDRKEAILLNFKKFGVGDVYPSYGTFGINGMRIRGTEVLYTPEPLLGGFVVGQATQIRYSGFSEPVEVRKRVVAAQAGITTGRMLLKIAAIEFAGEEDAGSSQSVYAPDVFFKNQLVFTEAAWKSGPFTFQSEVALSKKEGGLNEAVFRNVGNKGPFGQTDMDLAYRFSGAYRIKRTNTQLLSEIKNLGPNFYSFGVPFQRSDLRQLRFEVEQSFLHRYLVAKAFVMQESNNLRDQKPATTSLVSPGGSLTFQSPRLPYITVAYMPFDQKIEGELDSFFFNSRYRTLTLASGYQYRLGTTSYFTGLNAIEQRQYFSQGLAPAYNRSIFLSQLIRTRQDVDFSGSVGLIKSIFQYEALNLLSYDAHLSAKLSKRFTLMGGYARNSSFYQFIRAAKPHNNRGDRYRWQYIL